MKSSHPNFQYRKRMGTAITLEKPVQNNPYATQSRFTAGYEHSQLVGTICVSELLLLQLKGDRPKPDEARLLEGLLVALGNLGPRHYAVRAAMVAGLSKSRSEHLLPIGLITAGGDNDGCQEAQACHQFITEHLTQPAQQCAFLYRDNAIEPYDPVPGFGATYGTPDLVLARCVKQLQRLMPGGTVLPWCAEFIDCLDQTNQGWLASGLCAAVCVQLGIGERETAAIFQMAIAPGILCHGFEQTHKPITAGPMLSDNDYELQKT